MAMFYFLRLVTSSYQLLYSGTLRSSQTLQLFLNVNLKIICLVPFLLSNFLRFYCDYCNTLLYFLYCKLAYTKFINEFLANFFYRAMLAQSAVMRQ